MQNRIIQLMPLPVPGYEFQQADQTGSRNESVQVVGAALTDTGEILTLCYNKRLSFFVMDPKRQTALYHLNHALQRALKERKESEQ